MDSIYIHTSMPYINIYMFFYILFFIFYFFSSYYVFFFSPLFVCFFFLGILRALVALLWSLCLWNGFCFFLLYFIFLYLIFCCFCLHLNRNIHTAYTSFFHAMDISYNFNFISYVVVVVVVVVISGFLVWFFVVVVVGLGVVELVWS